MPVLRVIDVVVSLVIRILGPAAYLLALVALSACASTGLGEAPRGDVKGCLVTYLPASGKFLFEPFLMVAEKRSTSENGEPEVWGFRPWNLEPPGEDGKTRPVNILAERFVPMGMVKRIRAGAMDRMVHCPEGFW